MSLVERIIFWGFLALALLFGSAFYDVTEDLRMAVERNAAQLEEPRIEASVYPGVPAALREQWMAAVGESGEDDERLWMTLRVANRGASEATGVTARLAIATPVDSVYAYGANAETFENRGGKPVLESNGEAGAPVEVRFDDLPAEKAALVFVAVRPDGFGAPPYAPAARLRWAEASPHHWREVEVTGRATEFGEEEVLARVYGLGAPLTQDAGASTQPEPVLSRTKG